MALKLLNRSDLRQSARDKPLKEITDVDVGGSYEIVAKAEVCALDDNGMVKILKSRFHVGPQAGDIISFEQFKRIFRQE